MNAREDAGEGAVLLDGFYWLRNFVNLRGGGHVRRWKIAEVIGGRVRVVGSASELDQGCPYLRHALWVRAEPPAEDRGVNVAARADRTRLVAGEIVDVLVGLSDATTAYYARHPHDRDDLVAVVTRLISKVAG